MTLKLSAIIFGIVLLVGIAVAVIKWNRDDAANDAREAVRRNNDKLGQAAEGGAIDYDDCMRAGRMWDFGRSRCGRTAPGARD